MEPKLGAPDKKVVLFSGGRKKPGALTSLLPKPPVLNLTMSSIFDVLD
jgi:hypothetical protein